jgi:hypothetical protein
VATDPVCGMAVDEKTTKYSYLQDAKIYIFAGKLARTALIMIHQNMDNSKSVWVIRK